MIDVLGIEMPNCVCTLPSIDPSACDKCSYLCREGWWFVPIDPDRFTIEIDEDADSDLFITIRKKKS